MKFAKEVEKKFQWIGEGVFVDEGKRGTKTRYKAFSLGNLIIKIGDFVLVRNDDALDPEDCMSCFVAQVKDVFDTGKDLDPYQAQVQWFSRVTELPAYAIKSIKNVGHDLEIVKDTRPSWFNMIDAETIFQKCEVLFLAPDANYECALLEYSDCLFPLFFCRYKFTGNSLTEIKDKPVGDSAHLVSPFVSKKSANGFVDHSSNGIQSNGTQEKGESVHKAAEKYCAIQIGSPNKCPRVLIRRIDDRILDSSNGNVRIFVADSNVKKIEEAADIFLKKLQKPNKLSDNLEKKPIIHSLISSNNIHRKNIYTENNEIMDYDSNVESKICNTPTSQKSSAKKNALTPLSKSSKNLFSYKLKNSPKKGRKNLFSTPSKTPTLDTIMPQASLERAREKLSLEAEKVKVSYLNSNKHENVEKRPLIHTFKSEKILDSDATEELTSDSDVGSRKAEPHNTRKSSSSKKPVTSIHNQASDRLNMNGSDFDSDVTEKFAVSDCEIETRKTETPKTRKSLCSKKTVTPLRNRACKKLNMTGNNLDNDTTEKMLKDTDMETEVTATPKNRKKYSSKKIDTPTHNRACTKLNIDSVEKSPNKDCKLANSDTYSTPKKKAKFADVIEDYSVTRSGRRVKSINYSESQMNGITSMTPTKTKLPRYVRNECSTDSDSSNFDSMKESSSDDDDSSLSDAIFSDETLHKKKKSVLKRNKSRTPSRRSLKDSNVQVTPVRKALKNLCIPERKAPLRTPKNALEESRQRLHVSAVPSSLPCRDEEYSDIYSFVKGCLCAQTGGCMYISGVPGTGKTATVHEVMRNLEEEKESGEIPIFTFVEVNGMWMTDPYQCYVQIFKALTGKTIAPQQAAELLEKRFTERGPKKDAVVLLVDELDRLWTRKQTVMYNIFDWPTKKNSKLIVLAIANTMDLPERMMMNRISSRLGLTRKTFQPYTFKQLQEIIMSRIQELKVFDPDAVQLVARKVAAVSGDARRALDICRFATESVKSESTAKRSQKVLVGMEQVDVALQQMFSSPVISAIRSSSKIAKLFFQCILSEFTRTGIEETTLIKVHRQVVSLCKFEGLPSPNSTEISRMCVDLAASHLILIDNFRNDLYMKIRLNVSSDDVTYALTLK